MNHHHACTPSASACKLEIRRRRLAPWHLQGWAKRCKCTCCSFMQAMQACTNRCINGYDALITQSDVENRLLATLPVGSFNLGCFGISHRPQPFIQGYWKVKTAVVCGGGASAGTPDSYVSRCKAISNHAYARRRCFRLLAVAGGQGEGEERRAPTGEPGEEEAAASCGRGRAQGGRQSS